MLSLRCVTALIKCKLPRKVWVTAVLILCVLLFVLYELNEFENVIKMKARVFPVDIKQVFNSADAADQDNDTDTEIEIADPNQKEALLRKILNHPPSDEEDEEISISKEDRRIPTLKAQQNTEVGDNKDNDNQNIVLKELHKEEVSQEEKTQTNYMDNIGVKDDDSKEVKVNEQLEKVINDGKVKSNSTEIDGTEESEEPTNIISQNNKVISSYSEQKNVASHNLENAISVKKFSALNQDASNSQSANISVRHNIADALSNNMSQQFSDITNNKNALDYIRTEIYSDYNSQKGIDESYEGQSRRPLIHNLLKEHTGMKYNNIKTINKLRNENNISSSTTSSTMPPSVNVTKKPHRKQAYSNRNSQYETGESETSKNILYQPPRDPYGYNSYLGKAKVRLSSLFDDPIKRTVSPSSGEPWPKPKFINSSYSVIYRVNAVRFNFVMSPSVTSFCDILAQALARYKKELHQFYMYNQKLHKAGAKLYHSGEDGVLTDLHNVTIKLTEYNCNGVYPPAKMDESYSILLGNEVQTISAKTVWGMLRALETFYQLLYIPPTFDNTLHLRAVDVQDAPAHWYRGMLVDTARHYLSKQIILSNIDAMSQNKYNVMHWHMVDDQSFPFKSETFPELWKKGAYAPHLVYSHADIKEIVDYARLRGIRVMPEFDTPGHTRSWLGQPGLLAQCGQDKEKNTGVFDVTNEKNYEFLAKFFSEVRRAFKDDMIHLGGDEVSMKCWYMNKTILSHLQKYTHHELLNKYFSRLHDILFKIDGNWKTIVWEEVDKNYKVKLNPNNTLIEVWLNPEELYTALSKGFDVIFAKCWYLDHYVGTTADWKKYYDCDAYQYLHDYRDGSKLKGKIVGGEACMWAEWVDDSNVIQRIWPRALAPAEKLWSHIKERSYSLDVQSRFQEQACRMWRRGVNVSPHNGPGHCSGKMPFDRDLTQTYAQHP